MTPDQELKKAILGIDDALVGTAATGAGAGRKARKTSGKRPRSARSGGLSFGQRLALKVVVLGLSLAASRMLLFSEDGRAMVEGFQTAVLEVIQGEMASRRADEAALAAAAAAARAEANAAARALSRGGPEDAAPAGMSLTSATPEPRGAGVVSGRVSAQGTAASGTAQAPVPRAITFVPARGGEAVARPSVTSMPGSQTVVLRVGSSASQSTSQSASLGGAVTGAAARADSDG